LSFVFSVTKITLALMGHFANLVAPYRLYTSNGLGAKANIAGVKSRLCGRRPSEGVRSTTHTSPVRESFLTDLVALVFLD